MNFRIMFAVVRMRLLLGKDVDILFEPYFLFYSISYNKSIQSSRCHSHCQSLIIFCSIHVIVH